MDKNITEEQLEFMLAECARHTAEQRLLDDLRANYDRLHRRFVCCRLAIYALALVLVVVAVSAALPAMEYDYITANHAVVPSVTLDDVRTTLAAL